MHKTTMEDIASALNISKSLVSLAIAGKYGVNEATRTEIIIKAIELNYVFAAKSKRNVQNITLLLRKMSDLGSEFWRDIIKGAQTMLLNEKVILNIISWNDALSSEEVLLSLFDSRTQGLMILNRCDKELLEMIDRLGIPTVLIDFVAYAENKYNQVRANNYLGGYEAAKYLVGCGHKKIIYFGNNRFSYSFHQRYHGFADFVESAKDCGAEVVYLNSVVESAQKIFEETGSETPLIANPEELKLFLSAHGDYSVIMCANDAIAEMAQNVLSLLGRTVGKNISLMTFDNTKMCAKANPPLTSINIPKDVMGKKAAQMLFSLIRDRREFPSVIEINTEVVERESVVNLNKQTTQLIQSMPCEVSK